MERPPYAIVAKLIPIGGFLMCEIRRHMEFANAKEGGGHVQYLPKISGR